MRLSILVPLYNEEEFIGPLLQRALDAPLPEGMTREIIVVDDGSTDGSAEIAEEIASRYPDVVGVVRHERNQGKGAAIRTAIEHARGEILRYPGRRSRIRSHEYQHLIKPLIEGKADVVYGSRYMMVGERRVLYFWNAVASRILTELTNLVADLNLTDMGTGYKAFRTPLLQSIPIRSPRFGIEPELTIKLARRQVRIYETPISYRGGVMTKVRRSDSGMPSSRSWSFCGLHSRKTFIRTKARKRCTRYRARRGSTAGWRTPFGPTWGAGCSRSGPASAI